MRQHALTINASFELTAPPLRTPPDAIGLAAADQSGLRAGGPLAASWFFEDGLWGLGPSGDSFDDSLNTLATPGALLLPGT